MTNPNLSEIFPKEVNGPFFFPSKYRGELVVDIVAFARDDVELATARVRLSLKIERLGEVEYRGQEDD